MATPRLNFFTRSLAPFPAKPNATLPSNWSASVLRSVGGSAFSDSRRTQTSHETPFVFLAAPFLLPPPPHRLSRFAASAFSLGTLATLAEFPSLPFSAFSTRDTPQSLMLLAVRSSPPKSTTLPDTKALIVG